MLLAVNVSGPETIGWTGAGAGAGVVVVDPPGLLLFDPPLLVPPPPVLPLLVPGIGSVAPWRAWVVATQRAAARNAARVRGRSECCVFIVGWVGFVFLQWKAWAGLPLAEREVVPLHPHA